MATKRSPGMQVAILLTSGFEQAELESPRKALDKAGATTLVIAPDSGTVQGMNHNEKTSSPWTKAESKPIAMICHAP